MTVTVRVLGTVQDGGMPHAGCGCETCAAARRGLVPPRHVASIAIVGEEGRALVVDATPDLTAQIARLGASLGCGGPCLDALLLTHAHVGHYLGLALLGWEAMDARGLPVWCTSRMDAFLRANRPWSHLVDRGQIELRTIRPGETFDFDGARVTPILVPHRSEDTDTVGLLVTGAERTLLYVSDTDRWTPALAALTRTADVALIDGTFYDAGELPGRDLSVVPHPFVADAVRHLGGASGAIHFTHLNHTNPLLAPDPARRPRLPAGFHVLEEDLVFAL